METIKSFPAQSITHITIKSSLSQITVVMGGTSDIVLRWTDTKRRTTSAVQTGRALQVSDQAPFTLYGVLGLIELKRDKELTLELPADYAGSLTLESKDEAIRLLGVEMVGDLSAKTTAGEVELSAVSVARLELATQSGKLDLKGIASTKGIFLTTVSGAVHCTCTEPAENYLLDIHSDYGNCEAPAVGGKGPKLFRARTQHGQMEIRFIP